VTPAGRPEGVVVASAPGRLALSGVAGGPQLSVALDRRATCRVEAGAPGVEIESRDSLTKARAPDVGELLARTPRSLVAQALGLLGVGEGLRVVTDWKLPAGSGIDGEAALALATTAAVARAVGQEREPEELLALAREAGARAGRSDGHGLHAALWGGVVLTRVRGDALEAERLGVDPGRIDESLMLVDAGEAPAAGAGGEARAGGTGVAGLTGRIVAALASGGYEAVVGLVAEECAGTASGAGERRIVELVQAAGGAARPLGEGRLVAVWAPPGARGPGRREAVQGALKAAGVRPLAIRLDLRGLELD
jgi:hypothetical protein